VDNTGRLISSTPVTTTVGQNKASINLNQGLKKGIYYVSLRGAGITYNTQKVIIEGN
jgi:hypothetical protein